VEREKDEEGRKTISRRTRKKNEEESRMRKVDGRGREKYEEGR
jgi:hypothetical protein